ncbi:MAG: MFS transporter [Clostridia bacterium]|nr:MFS transporter [Clostridia bacterium]
MGKLNRNQKTLISVHLIRMILELFTNTFLTSHILSFSADNVLGTGLLNVGLFFVAEFTVYAILYYIVCFYVDRSNRIGFLRVGIFVNLCLLVLLVFFGEQLASWVILAGVIVGISDAFYYPSYLVMKNEFTSRKTVKEYNISSTILTNISKVVVPTLLGFLIDVSSYSNIAIYIIIISLLQFGLSFIIKTKRPENSQFELKPFFKFLKDNKDVRNKIKYTYFNAFLVGAKSTYKIIVIVLTIYTFKTNLSLGLFTSAFSILTILLLMLFKKLDNKQTANKLWFYLLVGILPVISCVILVAKMTKVTLIIYNFFLTVATYFSEYFGSSERDAIIKHIGKYEYIAEHQFLIETLQNVSRMIAYGVLAVVGLIGNITVFKVLLIVLILSNPLKYLVMYKQRKIRIEFEMAAAAKQTNEVIAETESPIKELTV